MWGHWSSHAGMASLGMIAVGLYFIVWQYAAVGIPLVMSGMVLLKLQG